VIADLLFPPVCLGCRRLLRADLSLPLCAACRGEHAPLPPALRHQDGAEALFAYDGPLAAAVTDLKYSGDVALAGPLGRLLAGADALRRPWDLIAPVPLHPRRAVLRGYNQAALLARWTVHHAGLPRARHAPRLLRRLRATPPQTALDAAARRRNLAGAFAVRRPVAGLRVLVLDDVTTTGATLAACLAALQTAGAVEVAGLALLRTLA
jgi:ComF family protein